MFAHGRWPRLLKQLRLCCEYLFAPPDVSNASRTGKGERGSSIPVVADTIPPPHRSYHRTSSEEGHARGEGGDGDDDGQVRSRKAEAIRNQGMKDKMRMPNRKRKNEAKQNKEWAYDQEG